MQDALMIQYVQNKNLQACFSLWVIAFCRFQDSSCSETEITALLNCGMSASNVHSPRTPLRQQGEWAAGVHFRGPRVRPSGKAAASSPQARIPSSPSPSPLCRHHILPSSVGMLVAQNACVCKPQCCGGRIASTILYQSCLCRGIFRSGRGENRVARYDEVQNFIFLFL